MYIQAEFWERIISVLVNNALGPLQIIFLGRRFPPFGQIAIGAELTSLYKNNDDDDKTVRVIKGKGYYLIVKSVRDFVPNNPTDGAVVKVGGSVFAEECALKDTSREFCENKRIGYIEMGCLT